jgi:hypothetical protein
MRTARLCAAPPAVRPCHSHCGRCHPLAHTQPSSIASAPSAPLQDRHTFESRSRRRYCRSHRSLTLSSMPTATISLARSSFPLFRVQLLVSGAAETDPYLGHHFNASQKSQSEVFFNANPSWRSFFTFRCPVWVWITESPLRDSLRGAAVGVLTLD